MRVLVVVHGFPPAAEGGTEVYAHAHARALRQGGDDVLVFTREQVPAAPEYRVRREQRDGLSIVWVNNMFRRTRTFEESYRNPAIAAIAAGIIDEFKPDVAHVHHLTCLSTDIVSALTQRGVPCILTLHDYWLMCHRGQLLDLEYSVCDGPGPTGCDKCLGLSAPAGPARSAAASLLGAVDRTLPAPAGRALRRLAGRAHAALPRTQDSSGEARKRLDHMRGVLAGVTQFLAPSKDIRDRFVRFGVAPDRITTVELGIDAAPFQHIERTTSSQLRLGFLGTLMISKAPHVLLEAFSRLPARAATVDLIGAYSAYHGDDSYRARLEPWLRMDGVRAHGAIGHDRVVKALASIDALVVPSIWPENSPLVIREAFLAGIPVIASRIGGIPELVEDGRNGLLFRPGDVDDLHRVLVRCLQDPALLPRLRDGIPSVRPIEEDAKFTRGLYETCRTRRRDSRQTRRTAAIVLNYGTPDDTWLATRSLLASRRKVDEIIVVNNDAAEDDPVPLSTRVRSLAAAVTLVSTGRNLGFSGGMNVGIREALRGGATEILLVNSDVIVPPDCIGRLQAGLDTVPHAGIAGPVVLARSEPDRVASRGISYSARTGRMRHLGYLEPVAGLSLSEHTVVDAVGGCLMLVRREVFETVGLFDDDYFFSFEDLDLCLRARAAGFRTVLCASARVHHEGGRSMGANSPRRLYFAARNHLLVARRSNPHTAYVPGMLRSSWIVALNLAHAATARGGTLPARLGAVIDGTRDYLMKKTR